MATPWSRAKVAEVHGAWDTQDRQLPLSLTINWTGPEYQRVLEGTLQALFSRKRADGSEIDELWSVLESRPAD